MRKLLLIATLFTLALTSHVPDAMAQVAISPTTWTGSGASATGASTFTTTALPATTLPGGGGVVISEFNRASGSSIINAGAGTYYGSRGWPTGTTATLASAIAANAYVYFTVYNSSAYESDISSIVLMASTNASGPDSVQLLYSTSTASNMSVNGGPATYVPVSSTSATLTFTPRRTPIYLCAGQTDTFKLYAWGTTAAAGTLTINNNSAVIANFSSAITDTALLAAGTSVCVGSNIAFHGGVGGGVPNTVGRSRFSTPPYYTYAWSGPGLGGGSTQQNPTIFFAGTSASGTYTFTATDSFNCSSTSTITISVAAAPSAPTISPSSATTICSNDSVTFSTTATSGLTYQWDTGGSRFTFPTPIAGATNATYYAHRAGNYSLTVYNSGGCSATSNPPVQVIVNPAPTAAITASGPLGFCQGGSVTLTASSGTGYTYQWYNGSTPIIGANSISYTDTNSGNYYVKVTESSSSGSCTANSNTLAVTEVSTPTISAAGATSFCQGGAVLLQTSLTGAASGVSIQWIKNGTDTLVGATTTSFAATGSGDYTCYVSIPPACSITTNDILVQANPIPNPMIAFNGVAVSVADTFTTYQWYLNTVTIPGATSYSLNAFANGSYRCAVTDGNGCSNLSREYVLNNLSVATLNGVYAVKVYPNPANNILHFDAPAGSSMVITSIEGKTVSSFSCDKDADIHLLPAGLYLISIYDNTGLRIHVDQITKL